MCTPLMIWDGWSFWSQGTKRSALLNSVNGEIEPDNNDEHYILGVPIHHCILEVESLEV